MKNKDSEPNAWFFEHLNNAKDQSYAEGFSLPGRFYTDEAWLGEEKNQLFRKEWICVGRQEEVANRGDYITLELLNEPIVIVRGLDDTIRALSNVCRHRGTVIMADKGNAKSLLCPYHHWAYDTSGKLVHAPCIEVRTGFDVDNCRLPELKLEEWFGFLFVSLSEKPDDIFSTLNPLNKILKNYHLEKMHLHYLEEVIWPVNWKILIENFMEGYHLSPLHRNTLHKVNPSNLCQHFPAGENYFGYSVGFASRLGDDRLGHKDLSDEELDTCIMFAAPPGLVVGVGSDYSSFLCVQPDTVSTVKVKMGLIFHGENWRSAEIDNAITLFKDTMAEDKDVLIKVQQGMFSEFHQPGPLADENLEGTIFDFIQYLGGKLS
jgi:phenylpropionate dioxygenase-like ring-hydroxylating dioxygenase large terminal subunit